MYQASHADFAFHKAIVSFDILTFPFALCVYSIVYYRDEQVCILLHWLNKKRESIIREYYTILRK